ncbi:MAG: YihY family inner membrane protein [Proteobacteria bacterium]|nr:YihY family inner membrane protein [Pseudomonadota bacterium]
MRFLKYLKFSKKVVINLFRDNCFHNAASIAYFSVLSFIPITFLITSIVGFFVSSNLMVSKKIFEIITPYLPNISLDMWLKFTGWFTKPRTGLNILSLIILFFTSTLIFSSVDRALKDIFKKSGIKSRGSLESLFIYFTMIVMLAGAVFVYLNIDVLIMFLKKLSRREELIFLRPLLRKIDIFIPLITLLIQILTLFFIFNLFIGKSVKKTYIFYVSAFVVFMWTIAIKVFSWYVNYVTNYNLIYGSMSVFIILISWCFYASLIFLLGGEILKELSE